MSHCTNKLDTLPQYPSLAEKWPRWWLRQQILNIYVLVPKGSHEAGRKFWGAGKMTQLVKALAATPEPDNLNWNPETFEVEGEDRFLLVVL